MIAEDTVPPGATPPVLPEQCFAPGEQGCGSQERLRIDKEWQLGIVRDAPIILEEVVLNLGFVRLQIHRIFSLHGAPTGKRTCPILPAPPPPRGNVPAVAPPRP